MIGNAARRLLGSLAVAILLTSTTSAVAIQTVPVGSPGNSPDPATGSLYGAVPYNYRIGTYDVTNAQYAEFLNAKASVADPYGLWSQLMDYNNLLSSDGAFVRSVSTPYTYTVQPGYANKPVVFVTWYDAIRFANWLTNGQGSGDTESGTYTVTNGGNNSGTVTVPSDAQRATWVAAGQVHWLLPSEDEWYKAAYYNPADGSYYAYPYQSNSVPSVLAPPGNANSGNYYGSGASNNTGHRTGLSDVGVYVQSLSPFGSFDMGDDVAQWNDTAIQEGQEQWRGKRGAVWIAGPEVSAASLRGADRPDGVDYIAGFRVANVGSVPEPSALVLVVIGALGLLGVRLDKRRT